MKYHDCSICENKRITGRLCKVFDEQLGRVVTAIVDSPCGFCKPRLESESSKPVPLPGVPVARPTAMN